MRRRNVSNSAQHKAGYNHPHALAFSVSSPESSGIGPAISGHRAQGRQVRLQGRYQNLESAAARASADVRRTNLRQTTPLSCPYADCWFVSAYRPPNRINLDRKSVV